MAVVVEAVEIAVDAGTTEEEAVAVTAAADVVPDSSEALDRLIRSSRKAVRSSTVRTLPASDRRLRSTSPRRSHTEFAKTV